jgi:hypothetical protein
MARELEFEHQREKREIIARRDIAVDVYFRLQIESEI